MWFLGAEIALQVTDVLVEEGGLPVCVGRDQLGHEWLIIQVDDDPDRLMWVCAQVSERALHAVVAGRAGPADAARHSYTGVAEIVTIDHGRPVPDRCVLCGSLSEDLFTRRRRPSTGSSPRAEPLLAVCA